ncbi:MAG: hypothetical protein UV73_C0001G0035 [Candidatus Gottesmanbacteria bacterium GW2011_GWA2_43_14]|uniref:Uncharacterized protein n=1 Tax=Candidatus Gottesmanbacteria bacterium GW2011_GWA2_43_14 TaxID=1618443 RepID=A0A0G1DLH6_9BACT|nr:MAG: hypothetical protein UV73_C0001G0035 [Candidatus Gottesmanbacteria bacterium GW2011_GWA2_43_14]
MKTKAKERGIAEKKKATAQKDTSEVRNIVYGFKLASDLGFALVVPLVGGALLGSYLDRELNTSPRLTLSLIFTGLIVGLYSMYRSIRNMTQE